MFHYFTILPQSMFCSEAGARSSSNGFIKDYTVLYYAYYNISYYIISKALSKPFEYIHRDRERERERERDR